MNAEGVLSTDLKELIIVVARQSLATGTVKISDWNYASEKHSCLKKRTQILRL